MSKNTSKKKQKAAVVKNGAAKVDAARQGVKALHVLSELVEKVRAARASDAMQAYLASTAHAEFQVAALHGETCQRACAALEKGDVAPHLAICCCADTFVSILTESPCARYAACELPGCSIDDDDLADSYDAELPDAEYRALDKLSVDALCDALEGRYECPVYNNRQRHAEDSAARDAYYKAVVAYLEAGAAHAYKIESASVRLWLEAIRLLQPTDAAKQSSELAISAANARQAYATAQRAQADLWIDLSIRKMRKRCHGR